LVNAAVGIAVPRRRVAKKSVGTPAEAGALIGYSAARG